MKLTDTIACCRLNHVSLLELAGPDARKFLQGQVTCDVSRPISQLVHGAHCTAKGRMVANFDLCHAGDERLLLRMPASVSGELSASLGKYLVFSKANLTDLTDSYNIYGILTAELASLREELGFDADSLSHQLDNDFYHQLDEQRLELWVHKSSTLPSCFAQLPISDDTYAWRLADIVSGKGWVLAETSGEFIPQHLNLQSEAIGGISFSKGCYTGQEIVARMHYKGNLKRHMSHFCSDKSLNLPAGSSIVDQNGKSCGEVVNCVSDGQKTDILAVVSDDALNSDLGIEGSSQIFKHAGVPYAITNE